MGDECCQVAEGGLVKATDASTSVDHQDTKSDDNKNELANMTEGNNSPSEPTTVKPEQKRQPQHQPRKPVVYRSLVVDSGAIIKTSTHYSTGFSNPLMKTSQTFYTVQGVLDEIKDSKSKHVLQTLPFELIVLEPSTESLRAVSAFARQTGDYPALSSIDVKVLALQYELGKSCQIVPLVVV
jgi:hypothetical protein